jgi:hypothetical protein
MSAEIFIVFEEPIQKQYKNDLIVTLAPYFDRVHVNNDRSCKKFSVYLYIGENKLTFMDAKIKNMHIMYMMCPYSTHMDQIKAKIKENADNYFRNNFQFPSNVIVFDMDETLITCDLNLFYRDIFKDLQLYRSVFEFIILWTHGTEDYLHETWSKFDTEEFTFDMFMSRRVSIDRTDFNKGLGAVLKQLNVKFGIQKLGFTTLVDDKESNFESDYDVFVHITSPPTDGFYQRLLPILKAHHDKYQTNTKHTKIIKSCGV